MLLDTTLRDGEQAAGVAFRPEFRRKLLADLVAAGVTDVEIGIPVMGADERAQMRAMVTEGHEARLIAWCRCTEVDLDAATNAGVEAVHISIPGSHRHRAILGGDRDRWRDRQARIIDQARRRFAWVGLGVQDASRAELTDLIQIAEEAQSTGIDRLRLADTVGIWTPHEVRRTVRALKRSVPGLALAVHGHNDLGMAVANSIEALRAGADSVDVTVGGLGERCGNAALETVAVAAERCLGKPSGIDCTRLPELFAAVAEAADRRVAEDRPVVGANAFRHESGIHVAGQQKDPLAYQAFDPRSVGREQAPPVVGRHSGLAALRAEFPERSEAELPRILARVRRWSADQGRAPNHAELAQLADERAA
jgi:homocitrate synthase NifV